jgi:hypothetical protein
MYQHFSLQLKNKNEIPQWRNIKSKTEIHLQMQREQNKLGKLLPWARRPSEGEILLI